MKKCSSTTSFEQLKVWSWNLKSGVNDGGSPLGDTCYSVPAAVSGLQLLEVRSLFFFFHFQTRIIDTTVCRTWYSYEVTWYFPRHCCCFCCCCQVLYNSTSSAIAKHTYSCRVAGSRGDDDDDVTTTTPFFFFRVLRIIVWRCDLMAFYFLRLTLYIWYTRMSDGGLSYFDGHYLLLLSKGK